MIALMLCIMPLTLLLIMNVPTFCTSPTDAHGNRHINSPVTPAHVKMMSSNLVYPLYAISNILAIPSIIINTVQAFVYHVAEMDAGNPPVNITTIHGNDIAKMPIHFLKNIVSICMVQFSYRFNKTILTRDKILYYWLFLCHQQC